MTPLAAPKARPRVSPPITAPAPTSHHPSRLLTGIYHDIGMAAVAISLKLPLETLDTATHDSVKRGSRYIYLMPKQEDPNRR